MGRQTIITTLIAVLLIYHLDMASWWYVAVAVLEIGSSYTVCDFRATLGTIAKNTEPENNDAHRCHTRMAGVLQLLEVLPPRQVEGPDA